MTLPCLKPFRSSFLPINKIQTPIILNLTYKTLKICSFPNSLASSLLFEDILFQQDQTSRMLAFSWCPISSSCSCSHSTLPQSGVCLLVFQHSLWVMPLQKLCLDWILSLDLISKNKKLKNQQIKTSNNFRDWTGCLFYGLP